MKALSTERRIEIAGTEVRAEGSGQNLSIAGCAHRFGSVAFMNGFREKFVPGAFTGALKRAASGKGETDLACLFNHDVNNVLGRLSNGTLEATETATGLHFRCALPNTSVARDLHASIARQDVSGCSFSFGLNSDGSDETWTKRDATDDDDCNDEDYENDDCDRTKRSATKRQIITRVIHNCDHLSDLGPVTYPAYKRGTHVNVRSLQPIAIPSTCPLEFRSLILQLRGTEVDRTELMRQRRRSLLASVIG